MGLNTINVKQAIMDYALKTIPQGQIKKHFFYNQELYKEQAKVHTCDINLF